MSRRTWIALGAVVAAVLALWRLDSFIRTSQSRAASQNRIEESARGENESTAAVVIPSKEDATPEQILELACQKWTQIRDYQCRIQSKNQLDSKMQSNTLEVAFKRPGMCRHQIVEGASQGTLLTTNRQGQVRARPGGVLGVLVVPMDRNDPRLRDGRGIPFHESDWGSELERWRALVTENSSLRRRPDEECDGQRCWVLELSSKPGEVHELWINQQSRLPARILCRRHGILLRDAIYSNIALNTDPDDALFQLK